MSKDNVEYGVTRDLPVDVFCLCLMFSTCIHMLFLLCENIVQICAFHVECSVTRDLTVEFLLFMFTNFHINAHVDVVV